MCRVFGYLRNPKDGTVAAGVQMTFQLDRGAASGSAVWKISPSIPATSDANGYLEIDLARTDVMRPAGTFYRVTCAALGLDGKPLRLAGATKDFAEIMG